MIQFSQPLANNVSWNRGLLEANIQRVAEKNIVKRKEAKVPEKQRSTLQKKKKCLATWGVYWPMQVEALGIPEGMIAFQMSWNYGSESLAKLVFGCSSRDFGNVYIFS